MHETNAQFKRGTVLAQYCAFYNEDAEVVKQFGVLTVDRLRTQDLRKERVPIRSEDEIVAFVNSIVNGDLKDLVTRRAVKTALDSIGALIPMLSILERCLKMLLEIKNREKDED